MVDWGKEMIAAAMVKGSFSIQVDLQSLNTTHYMYDSMIPVISLYFCIFIYKMARVKYPSLISSEDYK